MKYISKFVSPDEFEDWKKANPSLTYKNLENPTKAIVKKSIIEEQHYICCYCCDTIIAKTSHIEHLDPRSNQNGNDLDYSNMLCSCNGYCKDKETCGHKKDNIDIPITQLMMNCEEKFKYKLSGEIAAESKNDKDVDDTITILNLNSYELVNARKTLFSLLLKDEDIPKNKDKFLSEYSNPDEYNKLKQFCTGAYYIIQNFINNAAT